MGSQNFGVANTRRTAHHQKMQSKQLIIITKVATRLYQSDWDIQRSRVCHSGAKCQISHGQPVSQHKIKWHHVIISHYKEEWQVDIPNGTQKGLHRPLPIHGGEMVPKEVVGSEFDSLLRRDEEDVDSRAAVHAQVALGTVRLAETIQPERIN